MSEIIENQSEIAIPECTKRIGWEEAFKEMALNGDDQLLIPDVLCDEVFIDWKY